MKIQISLTDPNNKMLLFKMSETYHWYDNSDIKIEGLNFHLLLNKLILKFSRTIQIMLQKHAISHKNNLFKCYYLFD